MGILRQSIVIEASIIFSLAIEFRNLIEIVIASNSGGDVTSVSLVESVWLCLYVFDSLISLGNLGHEGKRLSYFLFHEALPPETVIIASNQKRLCRAKAHWYKGRGCSA